MKVIKLIFIMAIITVALTITITMKTTKSSGEPAAAHEEIKPAPVMKRASRFLTAAQERNPRAADHCKKDNEICYILEGKNSTCCNNKCIDLNYDDKNCGACKNKCNFSQTCCRGECVNLSYDKRHCGTCNNRCMAGGYRIYGTCDYA